MKHQARIAVAAAALLSISAHAGPYGDDLSKCLVDSSTKDDRAALVRWMFAAAAAHPAVSSIASVTPEAMDQANKTTGTLFMKLLTVSCRDKASKALSYEGPATMQLSFQVLGQVAASELFSSPEVKQSMAGLQKYVDADKLKALTAK